MQKACDDLSPIKAGEVVITPGFALPARYIIHAAGPVYDASSPKESEKLLRAAYLNSLNLAKDYNCKNIAFPLISSGIYGYPKDEALRVATAAIKDFLDSHDMDIYLTVFDKDAFMVSEKLLGEVASYIDDNYIEKHKLSRRELLDIERRSLADAIHIEYDSPLPQISEEVLKAPAGIDDLIDNLDEPFSTTLLRLIDANGKTDVEVYKRANLDRKLFSKIRTGKGYMPSKRTAIALAIALELNLDETDDLLERAGYALSHSQKFDVIIEYFIINGKYDIFEINEVLFKYDQPLLGG